jgi:hypothetical protein
MGIDRVGDIGGSGKEERDKEEGDKGERSKQQLLFIACGSIHPSSFHTSSVCQHHAFYDGNSGVREVARKSTDSLPLFRSLEAAVQKNHRVG